MFYGAAEFNNDIVSWDVTAVKDMTVSLLLVDTLTKKCIIFNCCHSLLSYIFACFLFLVHVL